MLARALARPSNLLLLDEPTNDLDLETLDLLQEMLADYPGTVVLVSHDRDFLDRVVTSVIAPERPNGGGGRWLEYAGGYSDMVYQRSPAQAVEASAARNKQKSAARSKASTASKLSFKDKHTLETLPGKIENLGTEISALENTLADPNLFGRDPNAFNGASARHSSAIEELAKAEEDWLVLEMRREELEAG